MKLADSLTLLRNYFKIKYNGTRGRMRETFIFYLRKFAQKTSTIQIFLILWLQSDNELPISEMEKNWGVTDFVFEIKRVKNYPNFDKSALVTLHGLSAC